MLTRFVQAAIILLAGTTTLAAQTAYPSRPVTIVVAFAAGGSTLAAGKRREAYLDAAAEWLRYGCTVPLYLWPSVIQRTNRLHNFSPNPTLATDTWNAADWWLSAP